MMINRRRVCGGKSLPQGAVDMGLPSGTLWAQGNIVKDAQGNYAIGEPSDYGCYFSWGNIDGHNADEGYSFDTTNYNSSTGSQKTSPIGSNDSTYDAAVARLGNGWHMPSRSNFQELVNTNNTTRQWTTVNGIKGYLLTSVRNGNTLFLPAAGRCRGTSRDSIGIGYYNSSSLKISTQRYLLVFYTGNIDPNNFGVGKEQGLTIRPVITI